MLDQPSVVVPARENWLYRLSLAVFGTATTGPYGPPVAPPLPQLRNKRGHVITVQRP